MVLRRSFQKGPKMNYPILVAGFLVLLGFMAHVTAGNKETLGTAPAKFGNAETIPDFEKVDRSWVQSICAFQLVSIDLIALAVLLFILSATEYISTKKPIAIAASIYLGMWGAIWLVQLALLRRRRKDYFFLIQWLLFFICGALVFWGSRSL
jgi:hypothetical protein